MIDVRDLAEWLVKLVEDGMAGTFNAVGQWKWGDVINACAAASKTPAKLTWVPTEWLEKNGMGGEDAFPIWAPPTGESAGSHTWKFDRAVKAGLKYRPLAEIVKATNEWYPGDLERRIKLRKEFQAQGKKVSPRDPSEFPAPNAEREAELLVKFKDSAKEGKG
jgi:2'-hydroxyisoflavone reductase